jgi:hypothetical protein
MIKGGNHLRATARNRNDFPDCTDIPPSLAYCGSPHSSSIFLDFAEKQALASLVGPGIVALWRLESRVVPALFEELSK